MSTSKQRPLATDGVVRVFEYCCLSPKGTRPETETFAWPAISMVTHGVFGFRSSRSTQLLSTGSLLLADPGRSYEVSHEHAGHDTCLVFRFEQETFDRLAGSPKRSSGYFARSVLPPLPRLDALRHLAQHRMKARAAPLGLEELGVSLATEVLSLAGTGTKAKDTPLENTDAIYAALAKLETSYETDVTLLELARVAGLSPFHFLRSFKRVVGVTPYRFLVRRRLRAAVEQLADTNKAVTDIAYDVGFGDLSNFTNTFTREVGCSPGKFRQSVLGRRAFD
ncbi:MAG: AraC family transcriptional regulator [Archangium sp.]